MPALNEEEFDWDDYHKDTRELSLDARGAWWDCLFKMRLSPILGRISMPLSNYATMFGCTKVKAEKVLNEIKLLQVGDVVTESNGNVTVINRRMYRKHQERESARNRQKNRRTRISGDHGSDGGHANVTNTPKLRVVEEESLTNVEEQKPQKRASANVTATRIPKPFPLTDAMREWAATECIGLDLETAHENFIEYWTNRTGVRGEKVDWYMTWRKGMKLALKWQKENQRTHGTGTNSTNGHSGYSGRPTPGAIIANRPYRRGDPTR